MFTVALKYVAVIDRLLAYCFVFFSRFFFPSSRSFSNRKSFGFLDCFTRQSPGIGRNELAISIPVAPALRRTWPSPSRSSLRSSKEGLGGGWAPGVGLEVKEAGGKGLQGSMGLRAAATECWWRRDACRAFACARSLTKPAASLLHRPPVSMPRTTRRHRWLRMSSGYVYTLLSASGFGQGGSCILHGPAPWLAISGEERNYGGVNC